MRHRLKVLQAFPEPAEVVTVNTSCDATQSVLCLGQVRVRGAVSNSLSYLHHVGLSRQANRRNNPRPGVCSPPQLTDS